MTALIWASGRGHTEVVDHLLEAGANPDAADKVRDGRECEGDSRVITTRGSLLTMRVFIYRAVKPCFYFIIIVKMRLPL